MQSLLVSLVLLLVCIPPLYASEADVHYGLTYWLARKAGMDKQYAEDIAAADQDLDDSKYSDAIAAMTWVLVTGDAGGSESILKNHFPSDGNVPSDNIERVVVPGSLNQRASTGVEDALQALRNGRGRRTSALLRDFGNSLHSFQDSWSHQGKPDTPFRPLKQYRPKLSWGHPCNRGGWMSHDADLTWLHTGETVDMASQVYDYLNRLRIYRPDLFPGPQRPWDIQLRNEVFQFASGSTRQEKQSWFHSDPTIPFSDYEDGFLNKIDLPSTVKPALPDLPYDCSETISESVMHKVHNGASALAEAIESTVSSLLRPGLGLHDRIEISIFLEEFSKSLYIERDISKASEKMDLRGTPILAKDTLPTRDRQQILLATFADPDHGRANALGHGRQNTPEILKVFNSARESLTAPSGESTDIMQYVHAPGLDAFLSSVSPRSTTSKKVLRATLPGSPFLIFGLHGSLRDSTLGGRQYGAMFVSENAPDDLMFVVVRREGKAWKIRRFSWITG